MQLPQHAVLYGNATPGIMVITNYAKGMAMRHSGHC